MVAPNGPLIDLCPNRRSTRADRIGAAGWAVPTTRDCASPRRLEGLVVDTYLLHQVEVVRLPVR